MAYLDQYKASARGCTRAKLVIGEDCNYFRDSAGRPLPAGQIGEVCWKTPDKSFGYLNDIDAAMAVFDDRGFYKSGDLGVFDDDGYLRIVGRSRTEDYLDRNWRWICPRIKKALERFAWNGPRDLHADIALDDLSDEATLDVLAEFLWACRQVSTKKEDCQP